MNYFQNIKKCESCGSNDIVLVRNDSFNLINPFEGSGKMKYKCKKCGYSWEEPGLLLQMNGF